MFILGPEEEKKYMLNDRVKQETGVTLLSSQHFFFSSAFFKNVNCGFVLGQRRSIAAKMT